MKIIFAALLILTFSKHLSAQDTVAKDSVKIEKATRNEIRLNLLTSILSLPEINYEYILKNNTSFGFGAFVALSKKINHNYGFTPYYRVYFSKSDKLGMGFFIEANAAIISIREEVFNNYYYDPYEPNSVPYKAEYHYTTKFGLGVATGVKFLSKKNFVAEIYGGIGRFLEGKNRSSDAYLRSGITIGKRF